MFNVTELWYQPKLKFINYLLLPCAWLFQVVVKLRKFFYQINFFKKHQLEIPVIVVGNITVGGTGKTPFVIWLSQFLRAQGFKPGIITRGFGGKKHHSPHQVLLTDDVKQVGDEALLLQQKTHCPLVICTSRVKAARYLLNHNVCNILISDDGLQHYALARDIEIAMVDNSRQFGNQQFLPAGPLRESIRRLNAVDFVVYHGGQNENVFQTQIAERHFIALKTQQKILLQTLSKKIHAVTAIGNPDKFFNDLTQAGFEIIPHVFKDHYLFAEKDFVFNDDLPIVMTEKDAIKCHDFADERFFIFTLSIAMPKIFEQKFLEKLQFHCEILPNF